MNAIGGYLALELGHGRPYHSEAVALNCGRNALSLILQNKEVDKVHVPRFTCESVLKAISRTRTSYDFYNIDFNLEPRLDKKIDKREYVLYTNYFGLKDLGVKRAARRFDNLIVDNSQAFFSQPLNNVPSFYSCRKFFGVPGGSYLYLENADVNRYPADVSHDRCSHLLKRRDVGAEAGYEEFKRNDSAFEERPIRRMSKLTDALMKSIDYERVASQRKKNFEFIREHLGERNELHFNATASSVPLSYPLLIRKRGLRKKLIEKKIFLPCYWPSVAQACNADTVEYELAKYTLHLPVDQRYSVSDMRKMLEVVDSVCFES